MGTTTDVVVVGGGIIGCATAAELSQRGAQVTLVEASEIGHGASGRNHGLIFYPQNPVLDPLYRCTHRMYRSMATDSALAIGLDDRPQGFIILVRDEHQWDAARAEAEACEEGGVRSRRLERDELLEMEPAVSPEHVGGWLIEDGYRLDPRALTLAYALAARDLGTELRTHVDVKQVLVRQGRAAGVITDEGVLAADTVVLAAGPWSPRLARSAGVELATSGARGWLMLVRPAGKVCDHLLESSGWHLQAGEPGPNSVSVAALGQELDPEPDIGLLIQATSNGNVLLGGSRIPSLRQDPEGVDITRIIARRAAGAVPALGDAEIKEVWSGVRPMSPDGLPLLGWAPGVEGLYLATGHGGQGVMLGGGSGRLAAEMIAGAETFTSPDPFRPERGVAHAARQ